MGLFPSTKQCEFWHIRSGMKEKMHKSTGNATIYNDIIEYEGYAAEEENGNETNGLNFEAFEVCTIERHTKRNIFIDQIKGVKNLQTALMNNETPISIYSNSIKITLPNDELDCAKVSILDEYKQLLAVFYIKD